MALAWMTEARRIRAVTDGGPLRGGAPRAVWLTFSTTPRPVSLQSAAQRLASECRPCHLLWDPETGEIVQLVSVLRAARALGAAEQPGDRSGHIRRTDVNTEGRVCVQIGVVAPPDDPFTDGALTGLSSIVNWLDSWGVPRRWPAGPPSEDGHCARRRALWARGGHFGGCQVPDCENPGPGGIDIARLTGPQLHEVHSLSALPIPALPGKQRYRGSSGRRIPAARRTWVSGVAP